MFQSILCKAFAVALLSIRTQASTSTATREPQYVTLPSLREQLAITDTWRSERIANIPNILQKYNVDAWLVRFFLFFAPLPLIYPAFTPPYNLV